MMSNFTVDEKSRPCKEGPDDGRTRDGALTFDRINNCSHRLNSFEHIWIWAKKYLQEHISVNIGKENKLWSSVSCD